MFKIISYIAILFFALGCKPIIQESSVPPGVTKEEASNAPANPNFNKDIRPLLLRLINQGNPINKERWQTWHMFGLPLNEFKEALVEDKSLFGVNNPTDLTTLWRWSQSGGSISHPEWLISPLKTPKQPLEIIFEENALHSKLSTYWLTNIVELAKEEHDEPFGKWFKESIKSHVGYDKILGEIFDIKQRGEISRFLADKPEIIEKRFANILGANADRQVLNETINTDLFKEFGSWERKPLLNQVLQTQVNSAQFSIEKNVTEILNIQDTKGRSSLLDNKTFQNYGKRWFAQKPSYLPLLEPSLSKSFDSGKATGVSLRAKLLKESPLKVNLDQSKPFSALSFWVKRSYTAILDFGYTKISISQDDYSINISIMKNNKVFFSYKSPVESITEDWNHILLSFNPEKKNGLDFRVNGKETDLPEDFCFNLRKKAFSFSISGNGALDELKIYQTTKPLTDLDNLCSYDPTIAQREFFSPSRLIYKHFFMLGNSDYNDLVLQNVRLREILEGLALQGETARILPEDIQFHLPEGKYLSTLIPLEIDSNSTTEIGRWLTADAAPWVARATVNWVHDAIHGTPIFDPTFPNSEIPDCWETIDKLADHFIKSSWDLSELANQVSKNRLK